jgi:hypothetical protein
MMNKRNVSLEKLCNPLKSLIIFDAAKIQNKWYDGNGREQERQQALLCLIVD